MKLYTKILIGTAAGIVVGLLLGPQAPWLDRDLFAIQDPGALPLLAAPGGPPMETSLPRARSLPHTRSASPGIPARLLEDRQWRGKRYIRLEIAVDDRLALKDATGRLKAGQVVRGWVEATRLPDPTSAATYRVMQLLRPVGIVFLKLIMMVIVPLVFASLLVGVASLGDPRRLGRLGGKTLGYFVVTTMIAITIGVIAASVVKPGRYVSTADRSRLESRYGSVAQGRSADSADRPTTLDNVLSIVPENPMRSLANGDMLPIIFFSMLLGLALTLVPSDKSAPVVSAFDAINDAMVIVVDWVMKLAPYGAFALVAEVVSESGLDVLKALGVYSLVVLGGLVIHVTAVYWPVVRWIGRVSMIDFLRAIRPAQLIAFSTSSSSAALPLTMECAERNLGVSNRVSAFVLPLGATVNMDGSALYQGVAAVFIAQVAGVDLSLADHVTIVLTATLASVGAAGVPGSAFVTLALVLASLGVPARGLALILGVDRLLDMFRTTINMTGDLTTALVVAATEGEPVGYRGQFARQDAEAPPTDRSE